MVIILVTKEYSWKSRVGTARQQEIPGTGMTKLDFWDMGNTKLSDVILNYFIPRLSITEFCFAENFQGIDFN